jgi:hypothetical protein
MYKSASNPSSFVLLTNLYPPLKTLGPALYNSMRVQLTTSTALDDSPENIMYKIFRKAANQNVYSCLAKYGKPLITLEKICKQFNLSEIFLLNRAQNAVNDVKSVGK